MGFGERADLSGGVNPEWPGPGAHDKSSTVTLEHAPKYG